MAVVDPATGLPMDEFTPQARGASMVGGAAQNAGLELPLFYDLLESVPGLASTTAWNMRRVSNTILQNNAGRTGARGFRQTFSPLRFNSLSTVDNISPGMGSGTYSPFNFLAPVGNKFFDRSSSINRGINRIPKIGGGIQSGLDYMTGGPMSAGQQAFARGTLGRLAASARIDGGNALTHVDNVLGSVSRMDPRMGRNLASALRYSNNYSIQDGAQMLRAGIGMTNNGIISGRVSGFVEGMRAGVDGTTGGLRRVTSFSPSAPYAQGAKSGMSFASKAPGMARVASLGARFGTRVIPIVGQVMIAYDIGSLAGKMANRSAKLAIEGVKSAQGDLNQSWGFGATYQDNPMAATSRARAVNQIAMSRMNARSMLGSEAALVASRYS